MRYCAWNTIRQDRVGRNGVVTSHLGTRAVPSRKCIPCQTVNTDYIFFISKLNLASQSNKLIRFNPGSCIQSPFEVDPANHNQPLSFTRATHHRARNLHRSQHQPHPHHLVPTTQFQFTHFTSTYLISAQ